MNETTYKEDMRVVITSIVFGDKEKGIIKKVIPEINMAIVETEEGRFRKVLLSELSEDTTSLVKEQEKPKDIFEIVLTPSMLEDTVAEVLNEIEDLIKTPDTGLVLGMFLAKLHKALFSND